MSFSGYLVSTLPTFLEHIPVLVRYGLKAAFPFFVSILRERAYVAVFSAIQY